MKYLTLTFAILVLVAISVLLVLEVSDSLEQDEQIVDTKEYVAKMILADISLNELGVRFIDTVCVPSGVYYRCTAPISETTSIARVEYIVDDYLDTLSNIRSLERSVFAREAEYLLGDESYRITINMSHKVMAVLVREDL